MFEYLRSRQNVFDLLTADPDLKDLSLAGRGFPNEHLCVPDLFINLLDIALNAKDFLAEFLIAHIAAIAHIDPAKYHDMLAFSSKC